MIRNAMFILLSGLILAACGDESSPGALGSNCSAHTACESQLMCISGSCQSAYGRTYRFSIKSAEVDATKANGESWDSLDGPPDPFVVMDVDKVAKCTTTVATNKFNPTWPTGTCDIEISETTKIDFVMWDENISKHDLIGAWSFSAPFCPGCLQTGKVSFNYSNTRAKSLTVTVQLK
jgi:hypothetical protein